MADAITLIVLVAASEASSPTTHAMTRAVHEALGPTAHVIVHETSGDPNDTEALSVERREGSDAVVELVWSDRGHREATLRAHIARSRHWLDRTIGFRPSDADAERGRTLGFAVASILPEAEAPSSPAEGPDRSPPGSGSGTPGTPGATGAAGAPGAPAAPGNGPSEPPNSPAPAPAGAPTATPAPAPPPSATPSTPPAAPPAPPSPSKEPQAPPRPPSPAAVPPPQENRPPPPAPPPGTSGSAEEASGTAGGRPESRVDRSSWAPSAWPPPTILVDALATILPLPKTDGYGAEASVRWFALESAPWLSFRVGGGANFGTLNAAENVSWWAARATLGAVFHPWRPSVERPFGAEIRLDANFMYVKLLQPSNLAGPGELSVNGGVDAVVDVSWEFVRGLEAVAGAGAGANFLQEKVSIDGAAVVWIPYVRALLEAGFRVSF